MSKVDTYRTTPSKHSDLLELIKGFRSKTLTPPPPDVQYSVDQHRLKELAEEFHQNLISWHSLYLDCLTGFTLNHGWLKQKGEKLQLARDVESWKIYLGSTAAHIGELIPASYLTKDFYQMKITGVSIGPLGESVLDAINSVQQTMQRNEIKGGANELKIGEMCVINAVAYWDSYLRGEIGLAIGLPDKSDSTLNQYVCADFWGDLNSMKNALFHGKGVSGKNYSLKDWGFKAKDKIVLDDKRMRVVFLFLFKFYNLLHQMSICRESNMRVPNIPS